MIKHVTDEYNFKYLKKNLKISPYFQRQFNYLLKFSRKKINGFILDLGCGTGEYSIEFQKMGFDVLAADISQVAINKAKLLGVKKTLLFDIYETKINQKFDCIFVKGFSPLNTENKDEFNEIIIRLKKLLSDDGVIFYWGITDFSKSYSKSRWYNWCPDELETFFELQLLLVFRWQLFLPIRINKIISKFLRYFKPSFRPSTLIGYTYKKYEN